MEKFTKEWCMKMAHREDGEQIFAGKTFEEQTSAPEKTALMQLVYLLRKKNRMTAEQLAEKADLDLIDVLQMEGNPSYRPDPRTIYNISKLFKIPNKALLQVSGITTCRDYDIPENALAFAACTSTSTTHLTSEETLALEQLVAIIAQKTR